MLSKLNLIVTRAWFAAGNWITGRTSKAERLCSSSAAVLGLEMLDRFWSLVMETLQTWKPMSLEMQSMPTCTLRLFSKLERSAVVCVSAADVGQPGALDVDELMFRLEPISTKCTGGSTCRI